MANPMRLTFHTHFFLVQVASAWNKNQHAQQGNCNCMPVASWVVSQPMMQHHPGPRPCCSSDTEIFKTIQAISAKIKLPKKILIAW